MRLIHLNNEIWKWSVGNFHVVIKSPQNKRFNLDITDITGESYDVVERGKWKKWWTGVKPSQIKSYIENNLLRQRAISERVSKN